MGRQHRLLDVIADAMHKRRIKEEAEAEAE